MALSRETLLANCRIRSGSVGGSGTVLYSAKNQEGGYSTYLLTNHHVVENGIKVEKKWSTLLKKDIKMDVLSTVEAHFFKYRWASRGIGATEIEADIMAYDPDEDLALIHLRADEKMADAVKFYPKGKESELGLGEPVLAVGSGMGEFPVVTAGRLAQFGREIENREFWLSTAPTIFGNSGGAVYVEETEQFIGVPSRISVHMSFFGADAITHLSYFIPITRVYKFLEAQLFRFIYDPAFTEEGEAKERERRRKEEERKLALREARDGVEEEPKGKKEDEDDESSRILLD